MRSAQTRGGGGSLVKTRPIRLRTRCDRWTSNGTRVSTPVGGGNRATEPDISGQQVFAACLAVPSLGQGSGASAAVDRTSFSIEADGSVGANRADGGSLDPDAEAAKMAAKRSPPRIGGSSSVAMVGLARSAVSRLG